MMNISTKYKIALEGNDLDVKAMQKLKQGDALKLSRVSDGEDTFEITVSTSSDKMLDMLDYCDSIGVASFIDDGSVEIVSATVDKVILKQGKSRAKDKTTMFFNVEYSYDEETLSPYTAENGVFGFVSADDVVMSMAVLYALSSGEDMVMRQPYLNMFDMEFEINEEMKKSFDGFEFKDGEKYTFYCRVLFDEKFSKCKVNANINCGEDEYELELSELEKQSALTFVNHLRIFNGEEPVDCVIE